jgi:hypothetical protein
MKQDILTLKLTGYTVKGTADLTPWGGGNACIEMAPFNVKRIDKRTLLNNINDNGFGVQAINVAICDIYKNYEGTLQYLKTVEVGKISINTTLIHNNNF